MKKQIRKLKPLPPQAQAIVPIKVNITSVQKNVAVYDQATGVLTANEGVAPEEVYASLMDLIRQKEVRIIELTNQLEQCQKKSQ